MHVRPYLSAATFPIVGGLIVGISGPLLESVSGRVSHAASITLVAGWMYALVAFIAGFLAGSQKRAAIMGSISLIAAVFAYYLTKATQGEFVAPNFSDPTAKATVFAWGDFLSILVLWWAFALAAGPIFGIAGHLARVGPCGLASRLLIPVVVIGETTMRLSVEAHLQGPLVGATWSVTRALAVTVMLALLCVAVVETWRRQPPRA
ncbi:DUF6518 family protein [Streptomyces sp. JUS-F4]|uniref:DUF6518 family protein n=1 Tax=Streptomyces sp. JUS-F4 TaxID=2951988 RepID=UPI00349E79CE